VSQILTLRDSSTVLHALDLERDDIIWPKLPKMILNNVCSHNTQIQQLGICVTADSCLILNCVSKICGNRFSSVKHVDINAQIDSEPVEYALVLLSWLQDLANVESLTVTSTTLRSLDNVFRLYFYFLLNMFYFFFLF
jgi:hypothetical protein